MSKMSWRRWGAELRRRRDDKGISQRKLARDSQLSPATISSFETASRSPRQWHAELLDSLLEAGGELLRLYQDVTGEEGIPEDWRKFDRIEREAQEINEFHPTVIPGILQTHSYAEAIINNTSEWRENDVAKLVEARTKRLSALGEAKLSFVLNEVALRTIVGSVEVQCEQVSHVHSLALGRKVLLGVIPWRTPHHPCPSGPFRIITLKDGRIVGHESYRSGIHVSTGGECRQLLSLFGTLQAESLPWMQSLTLLKQIEKDLDNDR